MAKWDKSQPGNSQPSSLIGTCLTLPNLGFLWVFFKFPKTSKNGNQLFFPVYTCSSRLHYWFNIHWFSKFLLKTSCLLTHSCSSWVSPLDTKSWKKSEKIRGLQEMLNLLLDNDLSLIKVKWINTKMKHHTFQQPIRCQCQWLHSSVGRASHQYREVMGSNSIEFQNFLFPGFFTQLHKWHSLRRSFLHFHFISAVHIWFISYIINTKKLLLGKKH